MDWTGDQLADYAVRSETPERAGGRGAPDQAPITERVAAGFGATSSKLTPLRRGRYANGQPGSALGHDRAAPPSGRLQHTCTMPRGMRIRLP